MPERIVIVGGGQAAVAAIDTLRRRGHAGAITLVGDEPVLPYQRPPLSKKYLAGTLEAARLLLRPAAWYADNRVELRLGVPVARIEREACGILLADGVRLPYDALLLATGSRPRRLRTAGADLAGVHYLRSQADADRLRPQLQPGRRLLIIGAGYIGLELAATARELGMEVTVLELAGRVMNRVTCAPVAAFYAAEHVRHGVELCCETAVARLVEGAPGQVAGAETTSGHRYPADLVAVGVGVEAADELAAACGLDCADGVRVDAFCRTSDPVIFAAGDCARQASPRYGVELRLESVDNAFEQGATAAVNLLGEAVRHEKVPWFWSDQYDLKLVIVGISSGYDEVVVRGSTAARSFSACYLRAGELIAVDTVNAPRDQMAARRLVAQRIHPDRARLADAAVALKDL